MKLQIINCLDLLYPYQVMRIVKKTSSCELVYDVKDKYTLNDADVTVVISDHYEKQAAWVESAGLDETKVIWFTSRPIAGKVCWVMPKAFEKEFDFEKFVQYLFCVINRKPKINLMESMEFQMMKVSKETTLSECVTKTIKKTRKKENVHLYVFIKDKVKRFLVEDETNLPVEQFWIKGIAQAVDVVVCMKKSWVKF